MIPYELIVASASRPELLEATLGTLLPAVDQAPERIVLHEDSRDEEATREVLRRAEVLAGGIPLVVRVDRPTLMHGPSLEWLFGEAWTEYVLYTQDDWAVLRPLPVKAALAVMHEHGLHQVRFNKRDTLGAKGEAPNAWSKVEVRFGDATLTLAPAWHFQTGLWRRDRVKAAVDWWQRVHPGSIREWCETKINEALNGIHPEFNALGHPVPAPGRHLDHAERIAHARTYIWGKIGEKQFIRHLGTDPKDWAYPRANH